MHFPIFPSIKDSEENYEKCEPEIESKWVVNEKKRNGKEMYRRGESDVSEEIATTNEFSHRTDNVPA